MWKLIRKDFTLTFIVATIVAAIVWHLTDDGIDKLEGK